ALIGEGIERILVHVPDTLEVGVPLKATRAIIYYGDSGIQVHTAVNYVDDGSGRFVWDTNFKGVWHMNQDPFNALSYECSGASSARVICDSTYNNNDAQPFTFSRSSV